MYKNKLKHYKPSRYRRHRKPINKKALFIILAGLVMFCGSVALGSYLGSLSEDTLVDSTDTGEVDDGYLPYDKYPKLDIAQVGAEPLTQKGYTSDAEAEYAIMKATGGMVRALSFRLTDARGVPSYKSEIYEKAYSAPSGKIDLAKFISTAEKSSISLFALFSYKSRNADYESIRGIRESYELAVIAEAYSLGVREMTLTDIEVTDTDLLYEIVCGIKDRAPDLRLGILIDPSGVTDDVMYLARLDDIFDYIALDLSEVFALDIAAYPEAKWSADAEYKLTESLNSYFFTLERYPSRVYIGMSEECSHCILLARDILASLEIDSFILDIELKDNNEQ